jgi:hypothetical protein
VFLPLRHFGRTHARMLGLITATHQPIWLGLLPPGPLSLRSIRILDLPEPPLASHEVGLEGGGPSYDEVRNTIVPAFRASAAPRLRLIQGGRADA